MKHFPCLIILPLLALLLAACETKTSSTPLLQASTKVFRTNAAGVRDTINYTDTLCVGDTARMSIALNGYLNTLTYFTASTDTSALDLAIEVLPEQMDVLATGTDLDGCKLVFVSDMIIAYTLKLRYVPRKAGTPRIDMILGSNAGEEYSPQRYYFSTQVK